MARVYLSIGSNIQREKNITACLQSLRKEFVNMIASSVYESEAVGFNGDNFYNLVVGIDTEKTVAELSIFFHSLEDACGRDRKQVKFSSRSLDIDILTYNNLCGTIDGVALPREEILQNAFVLQPLAELAPSEKHPLNKQSYLSLWQSFDQGQQALWVVPFDMNSL